MDYSFVRKLMKGVSETEAHKIYQTLSLNGIEVFVKKDNKYCNMTMDSTLEDGDLYVSAADLRAAKVVVKELELGAYLCNEAESSANVEKSEVEKAEEEFYKKHRQNQIFAWIIIAVMIAFLIFSQV